MRISFILVRKERDQTDHRDGTLWIYGDSVGDLFYKSISKRALCHEIFANCNHTYNWVYALQNMNITQAKKEWDNKDFSIDRIISELDDVLSDASMNDRSVIIINMGLHYIQGVNFTSYKKLIERTIDLLNSHRHSPQGFHGKAIWKTTTALYKERYGDPKTGARHAKGLRFLTVQVSFHASFYHRESEIQKVLIESVPKTFMYSPFFLHFILFHNKKGGSLLTY